MGTVEWMGKPGATIPSPGPSAEHFRKFEITSQIESPDIRMQGSSEEEESSQAERAAQFEASVGRYRRPELFEFAEQLTEDEIREYAYNLIQVWLDRYIDKGKPPNEYQLDQLAVSAAGRLKILRKLMDRPGYRHTPEEEQTGLIAGSFWREAPDNLIRRHAKKEVEIRENKEKPGVRVWVDTKTGEELGLYDDDRGRARILGIDQEKYISRILVGSEVLPGEARKRRERLADEIERQVRHVEAWSGVLAKVYEQDMFAQDLDSYVEKQFLRIGKAIARTQYYGEIFGAPPSREGLAPFGRKIALAYDAWREIGEGRARATIEFEGMAPVEMVIPNYYAYAQNQGLRDLCMEYVKARIVQECPADTTKIEMIDEIREEEDEENKSAAQAGFVFMDHWDNDATYAMDVLRREEGALDEVMMEGALNDKFKLIWATPRRYKEGFGNVPLARASIMNEWWDIVKKRDGLRKTGLKTEQSRKLQLDLEGKEKELLRKLRRAHPRERGPWVNIKVLPQMTGPFLEVATVQVLATSRTGKKEIKEVTIDQRIFGAKDKNGNRILVKDGRTEVRQAKDSSKVTDEDYWTFELTDLTDRELWDTVQVVIKTANGDIVLMPLSSIRKIKASPVKELPSDESERKELESKKMRIAVGTSTNAQEVPQFLFDYYALAIYNEYVRTDSEAQFLEYTRNDHDFKALKKLNKRFEIGSRILKAQAQLSDDTAEDLQEFERICLVAGVCASVVKSQPGEKEKKGQVGMLGMPKPEPKVGTGRYPEQQPTIPNSVALNYDDVRNEMERAIFKASFVRTVANDQGEISWAEDKDKELFEFIIKNRNKAPFSPWDLKRSGLNYFTAQQLEELKPLYSFLPEEEKT